MPPLMTDGAVVGRRPGSLDPRPEGILCGVCSMPSPESPLDSCHLHGGNLLANLHFPGSVAVPSCLTSSLQRFLEPPPHNPPALAHVEVHFGKTKKGQHVLFVMDLIVSPQIHMLKP